MGHPHRGRNGQEARDEPERNPDVPSVHTVLWRGPLVLKVLLRKMKSPQVPKPSTIWKSWVSEVSPRMWHVYGRPGIVFHIRAGGHVHHAFTGAGNPSPGDDHCL